MRILVATEAWHPQVNGVVRTLTSLADGLRPLGAEVEFLTPEGMPTVAPPGLSGIRVALPDPRRVAARIAATAPDAIHIATEGPIGLAVRWCCARRGRPFTTSFHGRFADYLSARWRMPERLGWALLRWFHNAGRGTFAATASLADELAARRFRSVLHWPRGVDTRLFRPRRDASLGLLRPVFLTVGRLSMKKNLAGFSRSTCPAPRSWSAKGRRSPSSPACVRRRSSSASRMMRTSRASTRPPTCSSSRAAATPAGSRCSRRSPAERRSPAARSPPTRDVVGDAPVAVLDEDLRAACLAALALSRDACRAFAKRMSWEESARCFLANVERASVAIPTLDPPRLRKPAHEASPAGRKAVQPAIG